MRAVFKFLNLLALIVLALSVLACYSNPNSFWQISFIGFAFPFALAANFFFLLIWLWKRDKFGWLPLFAIVLCWSFIRSSFGLNYFSTNEEQGIKLLTWNVKNFDLYNWSGNKNTRGKMMDLIRRENPSIICLQEFYSDNNKILGNVSYLADSLGYKNYFFVPVAEKTKQPKSDIQRIKWNNEALHQQWGVAIFSKYEILGTGRIDFPNSKFNSGVYADLKINGKKIRVYSAHLESVHLHKEDYYTIEDIEDNQKPDWLSVKNILRKMKLATTKRAEQAQVLKQALDDYCCEQILCGDFNDVPVSFTSHTLRENFQDAFVEKGKGFGATFLSRLSLFRIDYALFSEHFKIHSYRSVHEKLSDHYPVIVTFSAK